MEQERIRFEDSQFEVVVKLAEGNPGAVTVLTQMLTRGEKIDPQDAFGGLGGLIGLDSHGIYGCRIWMLYSDVCGKDLVKTLGLLRACQLGELSEAALNKAIDNRGEGVDVDEMLSAVRKRLGVFGDK